MTRSIAVLLVLWLSGCAPGFSNVARPPVAPPQYTISLRATLTDGGVVEMGGAYIWSMDPDEARADDLRRIHEAEQMVDNRVAQLLVIAGGFLMAGMLVGAVAHPIGVR